jgi:hypothetical protein
VTFLFLLHFLEPTADLDLAAEVHNKTRQDTQDKTRQDKTRREFGVMAQDKTRQDQNPYIKLKSSIFSFASDQKYQNIPQTLFPPIRPI